MQQVLLFHGNTSDALKASMPSVLCCSRYQADKTGNRPKASERKCAVHAVREYAQEIISNPAMTDGTHRCSVCVQPPVTTNIKLTQFVGLIQGSTLRSPKILIGPVHSLLDNGNNGGTMVMVDQRCQLSCNQEHKPGLYHLNHGVRPIHKSLTKNLVI